MTLGYAAYLQDTAGAIRPRSGLQARHELRYTRGARQPPVPTDQEAQRVGNEAPVLESVKEHLYRTQEHRHPIAPWPNRMEQVRTWSIPGESVSGSSLFVNPTISGAASSSPLSSKPTNAVEE